MNVWMCRCMCMYVLRATISAEIALLSCLLATCMCYCHLDLSWANKWLIYWLIDVMWFLRYTCRQTDEHWQTHNNHNIPLSYNRGGGRSDEHERLRQVCFLCPEKGSVGSLSKAGRYRDIMHARKARGGWISIINTTLVVNLHALLKSYRAPVLLTSRA